jgi:hypothetical protein
MQRRHWIVMLLSCAVVALVGCSKNSGATATAGELKPLTVDEVATRIAANDGKTFVFDDNPKESWVKAHVPGAKWLDDEAVTAVELPADKTATLIFYCHNET